MNSFPTLVAGILVSASEESSTEQGYNVAMDTNADRFSGKGSARRAFGARGLHTRTCVSRN